ncbi:hypothetical protein [Salibacterium qingdaonense]|uniref:Uncharacterized protein n=1 Tax=Salibacterium qingdaonense TaxID=266892 RepID=A0A1I4QCX8_9BACI|nr:hypothetical protein [Salibacterium qingdaonense]SFM37918.1 hypothetical protein SAMN04488054_14023 [Salibacterium qingdaonense]
MILLESISFGLAIFIGWLVLDYAKEKQWRKEKVAESFLVGVIGAAGWAAFDLILLL